MTLSTFTAGQVLTATALNNVHKQCVIVCTSTTRPSSPPEGMTIYETDTDKMLVYVSATTGWVPPWNKPWGVVATTSGGTSGYGYVKLTSSAQTTTTSADVTNATATFTAVANRLYRVTAQCGMTASATTSAQLQVLVDGTASATVVTGVLTSGLYQDRMPAVVYATTLTAGSHTIKLNVSVAGSGANTLTITNSVASPTIFVVEDAGPAGAPA